jgi:uracil-DNA glycosylase
MDGVESALLRSLDPRLERLDEEHVRELTAIIEGIRQRPGRPHVPNVDPNDGGSLASALFLLESPGPKAVGTEFVSRDNPDPSARNMGRALDNAGFSRKEYVLWNVVPQCISTREQNRKPSRTQVGDAVADTLNFIRALKEPKVIVFCGRAASGRAGIDGLKGHEASTGVARSGLGYDAG